MEKLAFENVLRLHYDSISLFKDGSYPSAFFLSVIAQEELGKVYLLDDFIFHSRVNGRMPEKHEKRWMEMLYQHRTKQRVFIRNLGMLLDKNFISDVYNGKLETMKQKSLYVGLRRKARQINFKSKILSPPQITKMQAERQITRVNDHLVDLITGIVNDYYGWDTEEVEELLNKSLLSKLEKTWRLKSTKLKNRLQKIKKTSGKRCR